MENTLYHGFQIQQNECGWFNVPTINCWGAQTIEAAKRAIDAHRNHVGLNENGVPLRSAAHDVDIKRRATGWKRNIREKN